jgi:hypothetical protein
VLIRKRSRRRNNLLIRYTDGAEEIAPEIAKDIAKDTSENVIKTIHQNINRLRHHKERATEERKMKRDSAKKLLSKKPTKVKDHFVTQRLDESIPLQTPEWKKVEQMLMRLSEFAPNEMVNELADTMAEWADDQARRGYFLGQEDLAMEMKLRNAA